jgi:hypothetical protein
VETLNSWDQVQAISRNAISGSYDPAMIAFDIGNSFAALAAVPAGAGASPALR